MEIIEIRSSHSLDTRMSDSPRGGWHSYPVNCRQFLAAYKSWQQDAAARPDDLAVMTLGFERIHLTGVQGRQVADAIQEARSQVALE